MVLRLAQFGIIDHGIARACVVGRGITSGGIWVGTSHATASQVVVASYVDARNECDRRVGGGLGMC